MLVFIFLSLSLKSQNDVETDSTDNIVEKVMDLISINKAKYSITFFPTMTYNQEQGLSLGAFAAIVLKGNTPAIKPKYYRPTTLVPSISYSTKGFLLIENDLLGYTKHDLFIGSKLLIYNMPINYYGIGTPVYPPILFHQNTYTLVGSFLKSIKNVFFVGITYDLNYVKNIIDENTNLDTIYGMDGGLTTGFGLQMRFDSRDDILYPSKGMLINVSSTQYFADYSFNISNFDVRYYKTIISDKNIIAFQATFILGSGNIPYYKLPKLGGQNMLRSINNSNKYINKVVYLAQAEYRRWFGGRFGGAAFVGLGNSLSNINGAYTKDVIYMYGAGFRFRLLEDDKLNFRFDAGFGNDNPSIFMTIREAF